MDKTSAIEKIQKLLEKYSEVENEGRISKYNEEMTKKDFILPLFDALGWKTTDSREVSAEEKVSKKRVDYGFRINGIPKFYLEAKSFKEDLDNPKFFEQAVSYAWHKGCTWAILTNFARIKILNAEWKARIYLQSHFMTLEHWEFIKKFEDLLLLSKESFEQGKLDQLAEKYGKKSKKESVDKQLLADFTNFRGILSKSITKLNAYRNLSEEELDESVQRILDRLIFIRNCEDRELEPKNLISNYRQWTSRGKGQLVKSLRDDFAYFDKQYNSKLFAEHLCDSLEIDNEVLEEVVVGLYYTKDRAISYDFSIIDADVLGTIYEQYLGHILKKTEKRAKVTKSHLHRKEQGIYYTPTYIVDYIVRNTLGELLKNKKVNIEKIRVLDPACGSGSFLIKAFDVLNEYYEQHGDYQQTQLDLKTGIPFTTKVQILQNNIFGVDLDKQAVEIAQLNLLLKIAEKGHRLPILEQNIKLGNSIIDDEVITGSKAFKWAEKFENIMKQGFDVVIGNPPYGAELSETERKFIAKNYEFAIGNKNTALVFMGKTLALIREKGYIGLIVPKSLAFSQVWKSGRELIKQHLTKVVDVSKAFEDVLLEQVIIILEHSSNLKEYALVDLPSGSSISIPKKFIDATDSIILHGNKEDFKIFSIMNESEEYLSKITKTRRGLPFQKYLSQKKTKYPIVRGKTISRYSFELASEYLSDEIVEKDKKASFYLQPKIISQRIVAHVTQPKDHIIIMSALDKKGALNVDTVENTVLTDKHYSLEFLLCLLNSKLISWYAYRYVFSKAIRTMDLDDYYVGKIPLPIGKIDNAQFIELGNRMTSLTNKLRQLEKLTDERKRLEEEARKTDAEIDDLVYKIYALTDAEKEIIKESLK
jgi:type I restriction-modification system DNA methylase subunit